MSGSLIPILFIGMGMDEPGGQLLFVRIEIAAVVCPKGASSFAMT